MAFGTEFVMGAGGTEVEEIPVSMSGKDNVDYPLATVNAGSGAWVWVDGALSPGGNNSSLSPELHVGHIAYRVNGERAGGGGFFTGTVSVFIRSRTFFDTTFSGAVYVTRM